MWLASLISQSFLDFEPLLLQKMLVSMVRAQAVRLYLNWQISGRFVGGVLIFLNISYCESLHYLRRVIARLERKKGYNHFRALLSHMRLFGFRKSQDDQSFMICSRSANTSL